MEHDENMPGLVYGGPRVVGGSIAGGEAVAAESELLEAGAGGGAVVAAVPAGAAGEGAGGETPRNDRGAAGEGAGGETPRNDRGAAGEGAGGETPRNDRGAAGEGAGGETPRNDRGAAGEGASGEHGHAAAPRKRRGSPKDPKDPGAEEGKGKRHPNNVRRLRIERMMSKAELARRANLSVLTIDRVEKGYGCRMDSKRKILEALGLSLADRVRVFGEEE
jgi:DNA-binding XRE family transcriptional regulator